MPTEPASTREIDQSDKKITEALLEDGRMSVTELAERVGLSKTPCQLWLRRLLADGFIEGFRAVLSPSKMQLEHMAVVEVKLSNTTKSALTAFNDGVKK